MTRVLFSVSFVLALIAGGACVGTVGDTQGTSTGTAGANATAGTTARGRTHRRHDGHRRYERRRGDDRNGGLDRHDRKCRHDRNSGTRRHDGHGRFDRRHDRNSGTRRHDGHGRFDRRRRGPWRDDGHRGRRRRDGRRWYDQLHDHRHIDDGHDPDGRHRDVHDERDEPHRRRDPLRPRIDRPDDDGARRSHEGDVPDAAPRDEGQLELRLPDRRHLERRHLHEPGLHVHDRRRAEQRPETDRHDLERHGARQGVRRHQQRPQRNRRVHLRFRRRAGLVVDGTQRRQPDPDELGRQQDVHDGAQRPELGWLGQDRRHGRQQRHHGVGADHGASRHDGDSGRLRNDALDHDGDGRALLAGRTIRRRNDEDDHRQHEHRLQLEHVPLQLDPLLPVRQHVHGGRSEPELVREGLADGAADLAARRQQSEGCEQILLGHRDLVGQPRPPPDRGRNVLPVQQRSERELDRPRIQAEHEHDDRDQHAHVHGEHHHQHGAGRRPEPSERQHPGDRLYVGPDHQRSPPAARWSRPSSGARSATPSTATLCTVRRRGRERERRPRAASPHPTLSRASTAARKACPHPDPLPTAQAGEGGEVTCRSSGTAAAGAGRCRRRRRSRGGSAPR